MDEKLDIELKLSYYREIGVLNEEHHVYLVQHTLNSRTYVKKVLSVYNKDVFMQLMEHPFAGIPKIHEVVETEGKLIVIEEYVSGMNLAELMDEKGEISEKEAVGYAVLLCDILDRLHTMNPPVIHRDIKPSNVMLTEDNRIVLIDYSSAKTSSPGQKQDTMLLGTHGFAAPEQYGFGASGIQTDIYAMGMFIKHLTGTECTLERKENSISPKLASVIEKCTRLEPDKRYSSALDLKEALLKCTGKLSQFPFKPIIVSMCCIIAVLLTVIIVTNVIKTPIDTEPIVDTVSSTVSKLPVISGSPIDNNITTPNENQIDTDDGLDMNSPVGTYVGNDKEKLVIASNGLAYYYCYDKKFTEVECPWTFKEDSIIISLSVLHCDISAKVNNDYSELVFKSESPNWNAEVFEKISSDADSYILDPPPSANEYIKVLHTGEKQFDLSGITFTIPKHFYPSSSEYVDKALFGGDELLTKSKNGIYRPVLIFVDSDIDFLSPSDSSIAYIIAYSMDHVDDSADPIEETRNVMKGFIDNIQITNSEKIKVAGRDSTKVIVSGLLKNSFGSLGSGIFTGYFLLIPGEEPDRIICIQMMQRVGTKRDYKEIFKDIIQKAVNIAE